MVHELFSFEYRFIQYDGQQTDWLPIPKLWKTKAGAGKGATRERQIYADLGLDTETRVVELVSDGRRGRVPA